MDQFAGDIAAMLEVALIGAGLVVPSNGSITFLRQGKFSSHPRKCSHSVGLQS